MDPHGSPAAIPCLGVMTAQGWRGGTAGSQTEPRLQQGQARAAIPKAGKGTRIEWIWGNKQEEWNIFIKKLWGSLPGAKWKSPSAKSPVREPVEALLSVYRMHR